MATTLAVTLSSRATEIFIACGLLIAALIVLCLGVWYYRRHWLDTTADTGLAWTLNDLRSMRDAGELSEEEYQALRATLLVGCSQETAPAEPVANNDQQQDFRGHKEDQTEPDEDESGI